MMTLRKDDDITQEINILRTNSLSQETIRCPCFKPEIVSQAHKDPYNWNIQIFKNFEKFKFHTKITKIVVMKNVDHHHINSCSSLLSNLGGGSRASVAGKKSKT